jgi:taurine dioxygenase
MDQTNVETKLATSTVVPEKVGPHLGAEIHGVDTSKPLDEATVKAINQALLEHQVIIFRDQDISIEQQIAFGENFGELSVHPFAPNVSETPELIVLDNFGDREPNRTDIWHSDETFHDTPPMGTILRAKIAPKVGGDTVLCSMTAAYEGLSDRMKYFISGLDAVHDFKPWRHLFSDTAEGRQKLRDMEDMHPNATHPVVRVHPETGAKAIYVNPQFTKHIKGMSEPESNAILQLLYHQAEIPEYHYRVHWRENTMIFWDNRSTQHYAPRDYLPQRRRMERITLKGERPFGVDDELGAAVASKKPRGTNLADGTPAEYIGEKPDNPFLRESS